MVKNTWPAAAIHTLGLASSLKFGFHMKARPLPMPGSVSTRITRIMPKKSRMGMQILFTRSIPLRTPRARTVMLQANVMRKKMMADGTGPTHVLSMMKSPKNCVTAALPWAVTSMSLPVSE